MSEFKVGDRVQHRDGRGPLLVEVVKAGGVYSVKTLDERHSFDAAETDLSFAKGTEARPLRSRGKLFKLDENGNAVEIGPDPAAKSSKLVTHVPTRTPEPLAPPPVPPSKKTKGGA